MQMIRPDWTRLKLMILFSVLLTVLKLRFSRVRKYFWFRDMVDIWPEILMTDSSSEVVCSGEVPFLEGRSTRASFSTCKQGRQSVQWFRAWGGGMLPDARVCFVQQSQNRQTCRSRCSSRC